MRRAIPRGRTRWPPMRSSCTDVMVSCFPWCCRRVARFGARSARRRFGLVGGTTARSRRASSGRSAEAVRSAIGRRVARHVPSDPYYRGRWGKCVSNVWQERELDACAPLRHTSNVHARIRCQRQQVPRGSPQGLMGVPASRGGRAVCLLAPVAVAARGFLFRDTPPPVRRGPCPRKK